MSICCVDFHTHSTDSDGALRPDELVARAWEAGIRIMAITDHNYTRDLTLLRKAFPDMTQVQGAEISCRYIRSDGKKQELHVVGLGFDPEHPAIQAVLRQNRPDRRPYIEAILRRLAEHGIDIGTYESLCKKFPDTKHLGRKQIATVMVELGYVSNTDEAFDIYLGAFGQRLAYVQNPLEYVTLEAAVEAILAAGGYAVLCHLFYYQMDWAENVRLVRYFRKLTGDRGAMEVYYASYSPEQQLALKELADECDLMYSVASDFHSDEGFSEETLDNGFSPALCIPLLRCLGIAEKAGT